MNLKEAQEKRAKCATAIEDLAKQTEGRALTAEERAAWDKHEAEWKEADADVRRAQALQDIQSSEIAHRANQNPNDQDEEKRYNDAFMSYLKRGREGLSSEERSAIEKRAAISGLDGTILIPTQIASAIEVAMKNFGGMFAAGEIITTASGGKMVFPTVDDTTNKAIIVAEYAQSTKKTPQFGSKEISVYTYRTPIVPISLELLQDSAFSVESIVSQLLAESFGRGVNEHLTTGDGESKPKGALTSAFEAAQAMREAISFDNLIELMSNLDANYAKNAKWMLNTQTMFALARLKDKNDRFIWTDAVTKGLEPMLFGKGIIINDDMPNIGSGNSSVMFGDFSKYKIRQVKGFNVLRLNEVLAEWLSIGMFGYSRVGGLLLDAGTHPVVKLTHAE